MDFFIWLFMMVIFFFVLSIVIQSSIDNTEMAKTLKEIHKKLTLIELEKSQEKNEEKPLFTDEVEEIIEEHCPACQFGIKSDTKECPSCGLTLIDT